MKNTLWVVVFVAVAAGLIWWGVSYSNSISNESQQAAVDAGNAAQQTQTQNMQNLKIVDTVVGTGTVAQAGDTVTVQYTGTLDDGTKFDSSYDHGQPFSFVLGAGNVIPGWDQGLVGMKVGGTRELTIPPELGYGAAANGPIPANSTLHFVVQLLSISTSSAPAGQ